MKLRTKYLLFAFTIHLVTLVLSFYIFRDNKLLFIGSEVLIIISLFICWQLYRQLLQPLDTLLEGAEAMRDRDFNTRMIPTGKHEMDQLIDIYNAMMDQLRRERVQQEQQHFFLEKLILTSPTGIIILDYDENIRQVNPRALQLLHVKEHDLIGKPAKAIGHSVLQEISLLTAGQSKTVNPHGAQTFKLQKSHFIDRGFARQFVMIEELTAEILAAEKKAYGKVIRMMAHEVNNTIGPVNSIIMSALHSKQNDAAVSNALQVAADRNNSLNIFMRNFADVVRLPVPNKRVMNLQLLLQQTMQLMEARATEKQISIQLEPVSEPVLIAADAQQMELVLINIIKNAMEAIETNGAIQLIVSASPRKLVVRDNGKGITISGAEQLFTPFYSTKPDGQGIGLTLIKEILVEHGFSFSLVTTAPGITEFVINFE